MREAGDREKGGRLGRARREGRVAGCSGGAKAGESSLSPLSPGEREKAGERERERENSLACLFAWREFSSPSLSPSPPLRCLLAPPRRTQAAPPAGGPGRAGGRGPLHRPGRALPRPPPTRPARRRVGGGPGGAGGGRGGAGLGRGLGIPRGRPVAAGAGRRLSRALRVRACGRGCALDRLRPDRAGSRPNQNK